jgi:type II secretory ATPase GspE/PulE/Tfp pilus assembly ATPase PilB-like protein
VASSLEAVLAQRLVRVLCTRCKQEDVSPAAQAFKAQLDFLAGAPIYRTVGCQECRQTGYFGRRAVFEWMDTDSEIRRMVLQNRSADEIREVARRHGMRTLAEDGWRLVRLGETTPEEILRVTKDQSLVSGLEDNAAENVAPSRP